MLRVDLKEKIRLEDYVGIVDDENIKAVRELGEKLKGKSVTHVNSTAFGGGVAEILQSMVPLMRDIGIDTQWEVLKGDLEFFSVTKKIHNALQGMNLTLSKEEEQTYIEYNKKNSELSKLDTDIVMVHDAQPAALIQFYPKKSNRWIWRCHVDLSTPNLTVWEFLEPYIASYDAAIFTAKQYVVPSLTVPTLTIRPPSINPLSEKNRELSDPEILSVLERYDIQADQPIITQVGRFDPWKDPSGAIDVYHLVKRQFPTAQLLLIAGMASDDPEGWLYFEKTARHAAEDPDIHLLTDLKGVKDHEVNAFQSASQVVLQMSTREGFGLTVAEALWKGVPVVGRRVGGIPLQIIDGENGFLVDTVDQAAEKTLSLLKNRDMAMQMGASGKEYVRKNFLIICQIRDYLILFDELLNE
ncbi:MAG: glycosyltransferase [Candidatus Bathyarchaeota archaeon]|nr:glycosyltransferase [Candidatus Bathyarchaeota archaeon]